MPIQFVRPLQHGQEGAARPLAEDAAFSEAFFARRQQFINFYAQAQPQPDFDLADFWLKQDIVDYWLTIAHQVSSGAVLREQPLTA